MLLSEYAIIGQEVLNSPVAGLVLIDRTTVDGIGILVVDTSTSETTLLGSTDVETDVHTVRQTLDPWALQLSEQRVV